MQRQWIGKRPRIYFSGQCGFSLLPHRDYRMNMHQLFQAWRIPENRNGRWTAIIWMLFNCWSNTNSMLISNIYFLIDKTVRRKSFFVDTTNDHYQLNWFPKMAPLDHTRRQKIICLYLLCIQRAWRIRQSNELLHSNDNTMKIHFGQTSLQPSPLSLVLFVTAWPDRLIMYAHVFISVAQPTQAE